ncbi:hypothetical protein HAX54_021867, partial [Datura stramonium]|nr:hypothetical protein [Datura stramonium]
PKCSIYTSGKFPKSKLEKWHEAQRGEIAPCHGAIAELHWNLGQGWNFLQRGTEAIAELKLRAMKPSCSFTVLRLPIFHNFLPPPMYCGTLFNANHP